MRKNLLLVFLFAAASMSGSVRWQTHLAYNDMQQIAVSPEATYVLSGGNLFAIDKQTDTLRIYTLQDGFSAGKIVGLHYDDVSQSVMVWHQNGYLDYLSASGIRTVSDLYLKEMTAGKTVQSIARQGNTLYMGMPYGVQTYDLQSETFRLTCYIADSAKEVSVEHICIAGNAIYAATDSAIYTASLSCNIVDYRNWTVLPEITGQLPSGLATIGSAACALWGNQLYRWNGIGWTPILSDLQFRSLSEENGHVVAAGASAALFDITDLNQLLMYESSELILASDFDAATQDYWAANNTRGLMHITASGTVDYPINSPAINVPYRMYYGGEKLFVVNGGRWDSQYGNPPYIMMYEGGVWTNYLPNILQPQAVKKHFMDPMSIAVDPADNCHYWVASYGNGLFEMRNDTVLNRYTAANSGLGSATGNVKHAELYTRVDALLLGSDSTLWMGNASCGIRALKDTTWHTFNILKETGTPEPYHTPGQSFFDNQHPHRIWLPNCRLYAGLGLLDYGESVEDKTDDHGLLRSSFYDPDGSAIEMNHMYEAAIDHDGNVWLCSNAGLYYFSGQDDFFSSNILHRLGAIGGFANAFLKDQPVNCIAVDSLNRKWIGTNALGVYVVNAANDSVLAHFATGNSPMPSNTILSIAVNPITQEVMIGTGDGIVSCVFEEDEDPEHGMPDSSADVEAAEVPTMQRVSVFFRDGHYYIRRAERTYTITGMLVE